MANQARPREALGAPRYPPCTPAQQQPVQVQLARRPERRLRGTAGRRAQRHTCRRECNARCIFPASLGGCAARAWRWQLTRPFSSSAAHTEAGKNTASVASPPACVTLSGEHNRSHGEAAGRAAAPQNCSAASPSLVWPGSKNKTTMPQAETAARWLEIQSGHQYRPAGLSRSGRLVYFRIALHLISDRVPST